MRTSKLPHQMSYMIPESYDERVQMMEYFDMCDRLTIMLIFALESGNSELVLDQEFQKLYDKFKQFELDRLRQEKWSEEQRVRDEMAELARLKGIYES